ncbi:MULTISPECIES: Fe-S cluster assembly protein SufD [unclassified Facklamia]|uniref:Fe-S cluster assembly protein SufD n=1 Tax=Aerococcaceae TaxID=186827 RepID=UPI0013BC3E69|nr:MULTISPECIES: Fe-S cluster assembly protein SufD [unclassified Facklamia]NEW64808.1 Fe-S cluster assembly protein SufD [Facklamia sp. 252]NEW68130.1 Fe-S cluster assembly protein SufD [Facklamia sp. 253]QQD64962.1 Fe-S cluster assembly protein SufD [Aerococcaceae bacterium zg-252]
MTTEVFYLLPYAYELPEWFNEMRDEAIAQWETLPLPKIERAKFHRWPLFSSDFVNEEALFNPLTYGTDAALSLNVEEYASITHAGNQTIMESIPMELREQGVLVMDLFEAMTEYPDLVQAHFGTVIAPQDDKVVAYNLAHLNGGIFIYIPKNVHVTQPIESLLLADARYQQAFNKRVLIILEENSSIDYLERVQSTGDEIISSTIIVEAIVKSGASLKYMAIDTMGQNVSNYIKRYAQTGRDARVDWAIGEMNDGNTVLDLDTYLNGNGSESQVAIVGISNGKQIQAIDSKVVNRGHHTIGNIFQHGVILDRATLTFNGIGLIENGAKHADAQQESRVLMLSDKARGDANPILLIEEFEVTAGHAASVGQIDEQQLYYLMSRGLTKELAEYLVIRGFLGPVILSMPSQRVRDELIEVIDAKLATIKADDLNG